MSSLPFVKSWSRHLKEEMEKRGHTVEVRQNRNGSTVWSIDGRRWEYTGPANRRMEIAIYGRADP